MIKIALENLEFYAFHGVYPMENLIGNTFIVDMFAYLPSDMVLIQNIDQTLNYEHAYQHIKKCMAVPQPLLETVAKMIHDGIKELQPALEKIEISIRKVHVPISGMQGSAVVTYSSN
jgi:dihydroneopterin aldolase